MDSPGRANSRNTSLGLQAFSGGLLYEVGHSKATQQDTLRDFLRDFVGVGTRGLSEKSGRGECLSYSLTTTHTCTGLGLEPYYIRTIFQR